MDTANELIHTIITGVPLMDSDVKHLNDSIMASTAADIVESLEASYIEKLGLAIGEAIDSLDTTNSSLAVNMCHETVQLAVSYTHLTLPTKRIV